MVQMWFGTFRNSGLHGRLVLASMLCLLATPVVAGPLSSCGPFDRNGVGGFTNADLYLMAERWRSTVLPGDQDDLVADSRLNVLDLVAPTGCVFGLAHGLVAEYYGYDDGTENLDISFPDLMNLPETTEPAEVRVADKLEWLTGWGDFLDADFAENFAAIYKGFLYVPEDADYTLHLFARDGARLYLDGDLLLSVDRGGPSEQEETLALTEGLYNLRVEYYQGEGRNGRILFDWSSNGSVIGPEPQTVGIDYLYHAHQEVSQYANMEFDLAFSSPTGVQVKQSNLTLDVYAQSPHTNVELLLDGQPVSLTDGRSTVNFNFSPGYNEHVFTLRDLDTNEEKEFLYTTTLDLPIGNLSSGLVANVYPIEWYEGIPRLPENIETLGRHIVPGATINNNNGFYNMDGIGYGRASYVRLEGYLRVTTPGEYQIRMNEGGAVFLNGRQLTGIAYNYQRQWWNQSELYLDAGVHHFALETYNAWGFPEFSVDWRPDGGDWADIPNAAFYHHASQGETPTALATPPNLGSRRTDGLLAVYRFNPGATFEDESGNGFNLDPDPRAMTRSGPGITTHQAVCISSEQAGSQILRHIKATNAFTIEADVLYERPIDDWDWRYILSLNDVSWRALARIYIQNDNVRFQVWNDQNNSFTITMNDVVVSGERLHISAGVQGSTMRLVVNGSQVAQETFTGSLKSWNSAGRINIGMPFNRSEGPGNDDNLFYGTIYGAAVYNRLLSVSEAAQNRNASQIHAPTLPAMPAPTPVTFQAMTAPAADVELAEHVLNRLAFGPSPEAMNRILSLGVDNWINEQMNPDSIDNSHMDPFVYSNFFIPDGREDDFKAYAMFRMIWSDAQMQEVMTQFWDNHFNTQLEKVDDMYMEWRENEMFRSLAFGNFRDLLFESATGYPMTLYLDNNTNVVGAPNENYAREIFELFSMGVNNGYTHDDIVEAARVFTGWTVRNGRFHFDPGLHDYGQKTVLGRTYPAGRGFIEGVELINDVAMRSQTADYITWKLVQLLVDDEPPAGIWSAASTTFQNTNGDIAEVLRTITSHADFRSNTAYRGNKTKTPLEFVVSAARAIEAFPMPFTLPYYTEAMGMDLYEMADPTGFEEIGVFWIDTNSVLNRWNAVSDLVTNRGNGRMFSTDLERFLLKYQIDERDELLDFFSLITTGGREGSGVRAIAEGWMTSNDPAGFVLDDATIDYRVRQTLSLFMRLPEFNKQ